VEAANDAQPEESINTNTMVSQRI